MDKQFTAEEKAKEAAREAALRKRVYENLVNIGEKTRELANKQIAIMNEIADDYAELAKTERLL